MSIPQCVLVVVRVVSVASFMLICGVADIEGQTSSEFKPVTDAMLQDPAAEDWLMWRRTLNGWGYSCLLYTSPSPRDGLLSRMPSSA